MRDLCETAFESLIIRRYAKFAANTGYPLEPAALARAGYVFRAPNLASALRHVLGR